MDIDALRALKTQLDEGAITQEEFDAKKAAILEAEEVAAPAEVVAEAEAEAAPAETIEAVEPAAEPVVAEPVTAAVAEEPVTAAPAVEAPVAVAAEAPAPSPVTPEAPVIAPAEIPAAAPQAPVTQVVFDPATGQYVTVVVPAASQGTYPQGAYIPVAQGQYAAQPQGYYVPVGAPAPGMPGVAPIAAPAAPKQILRKTAGILAVALLGMFGVHKFYMGLTKPALIMLLVSLIGFITVVAPATMFFIGLIEGITYLKMTDEEFKTTYLEGKKAWF